MNTIKTLLFLLPFSLLLSQCNPAKKVINEPFSEFKYRTNEIYIKNTLSNVTVTEGTFTITDFKITKGEDPQNKIRDGLKKSYKGNNGSFSYQVGRNSSSEVGDWFNDQVAKNQNTFNKEANKLRFAFIGTLTIEVTGGLLGTNKDTYTFDNIIFAQEYVTGGPRYWFGGTNCTYTEDNMVKCTGSSTLCNPSIGVEVIFKRGGNGLKDVNIESINYDPS